MDFLLEKYSSELAKKAAKALSKVSIKEPDADSRGTFEVVMTAETVDRDGEIISVEGLDLKTYQKKNPVLLWAHRFMDPPIGKVTEITQDGTKLVAKGFFAGTKFAQEIRQLYDEGVLNSVSIGFIPLEREGNTITKAELLELSFVPVPSNREANAVRMFKTFVEKYNLDSSVTNKQAVPSHDPKKADIDRSWDSVSAVKRIREWASSDGSGDKDKIDFSKYKFGFAWFDGEKADSYGAYKLPHQDIIDGKLVTVWRGVVAAMGALLGARGGVDIPDEQRKAVYDHLADHYRQFDEEPPKFSSYAPEELKALFPEVFAEKAVENCEGCSELSEMKAGRVLSAKNRTKIKSAVDALAKASEALEGLLDLTESADDKTALAERNVRIVQGIQKMLEESIKTSKQILNH